VKLAEEYQRFSIGWLHNLEMRTAQVALLFLGYAPGKMMASSDRAPALRLKISALPQG